MAKTINQLVAEALSEVSKNANGNILHSRNMKPKQQALLVKQGYLKRIIKGWYLFDADLSVQSAGESVLWYESMWAFIGQYLSSRFKDKYWLSAEASLDIHTHNNSIPAQLVAFVMNGTEGITQLPNNMSLLIVNSKTKPDVLTQSRGVVIFPLETALANSVPTSFQKNPVSMQVALRAAELDKLAEALLRSKNVASAGRIIGAYGALEMRVESKKLESIIGSAFGDIKVKDPFLVPPVILAAGKKENASARRIRIIWEQMRDEVIKGGSSIKPNFDFHSRSLDETLASIDEVYVHDAYHSLSIEGYAVTPELIEKVSRGDWSPETVTQDNDAKNALAARGYYDAFNQVKQSLTLAYSKENLDYLIDVGITQWHTSMFKPCVTAGIISELDLAGYRKGPIYIKASKHVPPASEQLMDCMDALKECIAEEDSFAIKAILGHFIFGYIHPYFDGNGRTARFLMNFLFVVGGYNWVIVKKEAREQYMVALESASVGKDIKPFVEFIASMIESR